METQKKKLRKVEYSIQNRIDGRKDKQENEPVATLWLKNISHKKLTPNP